MIARPIDRLHCLLKVAATFGALVYSGAALADEPDTSTYLSIGPGEYLTPSYPGASSSRGFLFPYIDAQYAGRLYSSAADLLGVYGYKTKGDALGAALQYDFTERLNTDDLRLRNIRDISTTPRFKLFADKTLSIFTADIDVATDIGGHGQGTLAQANLFVTIPFIPKWLFSFGPGIAWADHDYMSTFFSITPQQAAVSPIHTYTAHAGIADVHLNGAVTYSISSRWSVGASTYAAHLHSDAEDSTVTLRRSQITVITFVTYKVI
jgi:outer membrane scaffolding protein for murein synthesis (MipA/OmpV family)